MATLSVVAQKGAAEGSLPIRDDCACRAGRAD
jgi:hypothetical protein